MAKTRRAALKEAVARLKSAGLETPVLDARLIVQHALEVDWEGLFLGSDQPLSPLESERLGAALTRRLAHEPVSRIVGKRHFWTLELTVAPATLDPRPDTEAVIEAALAELPDRTQPLRILDLGVGTGALLLALLTEFPGATGIGVDSSAEAAEAARANAVALGLADRATIAVGSWTEMVAGPFDLIVSNPPYIARPDLAGLPRGVRDYDPIMALDGGPDGLDAYRAILPALPALLAPGGLAVLEIGAGQGAAITGLAAESGLTVTSRRADLGGVERALVLRPAG